jgi:Fic family protein
LLGVARMSEDALSRAARMNAKLAKWQKQVAGESSNAPVRVVELLASNPFITAKGAAEKLDVAFTTAQRAIARLERGGILKPVSEAKRNRVYCAQALLDILEEPVQLTPTESL